MDTKICPLFDTLENLIITLKSAKTSGSYSSNYEYYVTIEFLLAYKGSSDTFNSYRRELEKLLLWANYVQNKDIKDLSRSDIEEFIDFCKKPPKSWITDNVYARFVNKNGKRIPNENWKPFVLKQGSAYSISDAGIRALFAILNSYFSYLMQEEYITSNPVALIRQKKRYLKSVQGARKIRKLSDLSRKYLISEAELMANEDPDTHERTLFIIMAMLSMYLRVSELAESDRWKPKMNDFYQDADGLWWFYTIGKGNKEGDITVSDQMLGALKRYRKHLGLTPLPSPDDTDPLIPRYKRGSGGITSTRQIRIIVQECYERTKVKLIKDGYDDKADELDHATAHWLRHTGISYDVKIRPREHVRDDARHSSSSITDGYTDVTKAERHMSAKNKSI